MTATKELPVKGVVSLRCLLFLVFGGIAVFLPFLPLHTLSVGLNLSEARLISIIAPLIAALGPIVAGPLVDFFGTKKKKTKQTAEYRPETNRVIRYTLASTILLAAISYSLLLAVPVVVRLEPREAAVTFACENSGAILIQKRYHKLESCYQYPVERTGIISLTNCRDDAGLNFGGSIDGDISKTGLPSRDGTEPPHRRIIEPETIDVLDDEDDEDDEETATVSEPGAEPGLPHICHGGPANRTCYAYAPNSNAFELNISLKDADQQDETCKYRLGGNITCRINAMLDSSNVFCDIEEAYAPGSILRDTQFYRTIGDPNQTFWLYLVLRILGDLFLSTSISLLIGAVVSAIRPRIGPEFLIPSAAYALFSSLGGYLQSTESPLHDPGAALPPYLIGIAIFAVVSVIAVFTLVISTGMAIGPPNWLRTTSYVQFRHKPEFYGLLFVLTLLGILWGPHYSHVPWHMVPDTEGLEIFIGCSIAFGALLALPLLWKADLIIDYCGYNNVLMISFTFYILRYTGLLFIETPWVLFITGGLEVFTLSLMVLNAILYIRELFPKHLIFTAQALGFVAHFCIGNSIGCIMATVLSPSESDLKALTVARRNLTREDNEDTPAESPYHVIYCSGAVFSAVVAAIYFIAYHCCLKKKKNMPQLYPESGTYSPKRNKGSNDGKGTYTPMRNLQQNGHRP